VDLKVAQSEVEAAVELLRTASEIIGYLIDELVGSVRLRCLL